MNIETRAYELLKEQYQKFIIENSEEETTTTLITKMNFIKKLEETARKGNIENENDYLQTEKESVLQKLKEKGISYKGN